MANNVSVKCVGVCKAIKVTVYGIKVAVDMYVIPAKGEGYPIILGRPWLIAMNARQNWEKGTLILNPPGRNSGRAIVYNLKEGTQESLEEETMKKVSLVHQAHHLRMKKQAAVSMIARLRYAELL